MKQFEDLEVWNEARRLTREIYRLTKGERFSKDLFAGSNSTGCRFDHVEYFRGS